MEGINQSEYCMANREQGQQVLTARLLFLLLSGLFRSIELGASKGPYPCLSLKGIGTHAMYCIQTTITLLASCVIK